LVVFSTARAETVDTINKSFDVTPGGKLVMKVDDGTIDIKATKESRVAIEVVRKVKAGSKEREESFLREHAVTIGATSDGVSVQAKRPHRQWSLNERLSFSAKYTVTVPEQYQIDAHTADGAVAVVGVTGSVVVKTSDGRLAFERITGPIDGHTSDGAITLKDCKGDVKAQTSDGLIEAVNGEGGLQLVDSDGTITIRNHCGSMSARTSDGNIRCENVEGALEAITSDGSIEASMKSAPPGDWKLATSDGSITVAVPRDAGFEVDAATSDGSVRTELPITIAGKTHEGRLAGKLGQGGRLLHLRTSDGSIHIKAAAVPTQLERN
jgi:hypothetical protein